MFFCVISLHIWQAFHSIGIELECQHPTIVYHVLTVDNDVLYLLNHQEQFLIVSTLKQTRNIKSIARVVFYWNKSAWKLDVSEFSHLNNLFKMIFQFILFRYHFNLAIDIYDQHRANPFIHRPLSSPFNNSIIKIDN